ncbi:MAG TPA: TolC family protein [Candidatus Binatia bacterium]|nr:TolC family protein [Candidatus Binatia bacterium]
MGRLSSAALAAAFFGAAAPAPGLTLDECIHGALARSPAVQAALADARAAAARVREARAAYWPTLAAKSDYGVAEGYDTMVTNGGQTDALVSLEVTLLDGGLRSARLAATQAALRSATAKEAQQRADIAFAVRAAYFEAVAADATVAVMDDDLRMLEAYADLLGRQEARGIVPHTDVLRARLAAQAAATARRAAATDGRSAREALTILTGLDAAAAPLEEPDVRFVPANDEALEAAPVVADARAAADAARHEADAVRSERRSRLRLTADAGALGVRPGPTVRDNGGGEFSLGFVLPLFDGGAVAGRIAAADQAADGAQARLADARQTLRLALARTEADARRAEADLAAGRAATPVAGEQFQLMRARYLGGGNVRLLEVLDALTVYADARLSVPRALLAYRTAAAAAGQALGEVPP